MLSRPIHLASLEAADRNLKKMTVTRNRVGVAEIAEVAEIVVDAASDQSAMVRVRLSLQSPKPTPNLLSVVGAKNAMAVL